jgi:hypothetical protein
MTVLLNNAAVNLSAGENLLGPFDLPNGTTSLKVTYACGTWPVVSDGAITVAFQISSTGSPPYDDVWTDDIQHVQLRKGGVVQATAQFAIGLPEPFPSAARARVRVTTEVAFATTITVEAL